MIFIMSNIWIKSIKIDRKIAKLIKIIQVGQKKEGWSLLSHVEKKLQGSKNPENGLFKKVTLSKKRHIFVLSISMRFNRTVIIKMIFIVSNIYIHR